MHNIIPCKKVAHAVAFAYQAWSDRMSICIELAYTMTSLFVNAILDAVYTKLIRTPIYIEQVSICIA